MGLFSYEGKNLQECIGMLRDSYKAKRLNLEVMMWGVESLRDSPQDMNAYFDALTGITQDAIQKDIAKGARSMVVEKVNSGMPIEDVAKELAYGHLRRLINHYNTKEIHQKWNTALPELKTAGGFATFI